MKPTVIASGNSQNPQSHPGGSGISSTGNNMGPSNEASANANAHANARQYPEYQAGFNVDPDIDDIFSDAGLRSRLNRFRDPFGFARKRCGNNDPNADSYSRYFDDDADFFPNFGSFPGRRRTGSQGASSSNTNPIFDRIPPEFRHYIPDSFGFPHSRAAPPQPQPQQQHPQQYYETYVQPSSPTYAQPPQQKPKLCDAAIQTEDLTDHAETKDGKNLKQYGMRNTVDLGQKSPPEECRSPRSQSAPPVNPPEQNTAGHSTASGSVPQEANATASAYAHASAAPSQAEGAQQRSQGTQPMTPPHPPPRQHVPNPQHQYQPWQPQQQAHSPQQPKHQQSPPQQQTNAQSGSGHIRTVPIFVEGRSEPVVSKSTAPPQQQQQPRQKPGHPTPLNTQQTPAPSSQVPPQTPHTAECISKIQAIQRDVLNLMSKVENFKGTRKDKEYMYLDEMLTRNLLKLDTIDTNGKDSIRLARREAIKCIQASINVLEAKAEENAKTAQQTVMNEVEHEQKAEDGVVNSVNEEKLEGEPASLPPEKIAIPLPPPPEKKTNQAVEENKPDAKENESQAESQNIVTERPPEETKQPEEPGIQKVEIIIPLNPPTENVDKSTSETVVESAVAEKETTSADTAKPESTSPKKAEEGNESGEPKPSGGAVKKKIIKKKKVVGDKKDKSKSESASPAEKPSDPEDPANPPEGSEKTDKGDQEPGQP